jgi:hypothetical protein
MNSALCFASQTRLSALICIAEFSASDHALPSGGTACPVARSKGNSMCCEALPSRCWYASAEGTITRLFCDHVCDDRLWRDFVMTVVTSPRGLQGTRDRQSYLVAGYLLISGRI